MARCERQRLERGVVHFGRRVLLEIAERSPVDVGVERGLQFLQFAESLLRRGYRIHLLDEQVRVIVKPVRLLLIVARLDHVNHRHDSA